MYVYADNNGRVCVSYDFGAPADAVEVEMPEGWEAEEQHNWKLIGNVLVYEPLSDTDYTSDDAQVNADYAEPDYDAALVELAEMLDTALTQLDEQSAALVELAGIISEMEAR